MYNFEQLIKDAAKQFHYNSNLSSILHDCVEQIYNAAASGSSNTRRATVDAWNTLLGTCADDRYAVDSFQSYQDFLNNMDPRCSSKCPKQFQLTMTHMDWESMCNEMDLLDDSTPQAEAGDVSDSDVRPSAQQVEPISNLTPTPESLVTGPADTVAVTIEPVTAKEPYAATDKCALYLQPPRYILLTNYPACAGGVLHLVRPNIPECQRDIAAVTDVDELQDADLLKLFPTHLIRTRNPRLYDKVEGLEYVDGLGVIIPVEGFSTQQIIDNIIRYPHLHGLKRQAGPSSWINFYSGIELNGELHHVSEVWDTLPESAIIPREKPYIREYVIRRYLLERDAGMYHKYELWGTLDPFLTLVAPPPQYEAWGYSNPVELAKQCVTARINYKRSRNPALRGMNMQACVFREYCTNTSCDTACARHAQFNYLMELNRLTLANTAYAISEKQLSETIRVFGALHKHVSCYMLPQNRLFGSTVQAAQAFGYTAICDRWEGSACNAVVYTVNYSDYVQAIKDSWSKSAEPESLKYTKIWTQSARLLILHGLDYIKFGDFECQTLLQLLQQREARGYSTLIIAPAHYTPSGSSYFLTDLIRMIKEATIK